MWFKYRFLLCTSVLVFSWDVGAAAPKGGKAAAQPVTCEAVIMDPIGASEPMSRLTETHSIFELLDPDPAKNLAYQHPSIIMKAAQRLKHLKMLRPLRTTFDSNYRVRPGVIFPVFSDFIPEVGGKGIVGQYEVIEKISDYIDGLAEGRRSSHIPQLTGGAGTGKTELLTVMDRLDAVLSSTNPDFYRYTYRFKDLKSIEALRFLPVTFMTLPASPYVLLPQSYRRAVVKLAGPRVRAAIDVDAIPYEIRDKQTQYILDQIYKQKMLESGITDPSEKQLLTWLNAHVDVIRNYIDPNSPPALIRYQGANPKDHNLFFSQHPILSAVYQGTPLEYTYSGEVLRSYGRAGMLDEFWRQIGELRNTFLEVAQNNVVANSGVSEMLDAVWFIAANDESVAKARAEDAADAQVDRARFIAQRQPLHPHLTAKTALYTIGPDNFEQKNLSLIASDGSLKDGFEPLILDQVYPNGDERGQIAPADGRYAIRYASKSTKPHVLIAPHSLLFIGLFAGATRLVIDPAAIRKELPTLSLLTMNPQYLTNTKLRLDTILGEAKPGNSVMVDLRSVERALKEGSTGITARTVEEWLNEGITAAAKTTGTLTPWILDKVFKEMVENPDVAKIPRTQSKALWHQLAKLVKYQMLLPRMRDDVLRILGAETGSAEQIYDEIRSEIDVIQNSATADVWTDENGRTAPINRGRLTEIQQVYSEVNGGPFALNELPRFHSSPSLDRNARFEPLMKAVNAWVFAKELNDALLAQYDNYFAGKAVTPEIRRRGDAARSSLARFGYDERAFRDTLAFVIQIQNELRTEQP